MNSEGAAMIVIYAAVCYGFYTLYKQYIERSEAYQDESLEKINEILLAVAVTPKEKKTNDTGGLKPA